MSKVNLERMTYRELLELQDVVAKTIVTRKEEEKNELKRKLAELADESGFDMEELFGSRRSGGGGGRKTAAAASASSAVKYRNPKDFSQTWTGRGRKPNWLVDAIKKGQKLESFAV
jgi:DNA-binding protein H-NS